MDLIVTTETRFLTDPSGVPVCADGTYGYSFWTRYLDVYERVWILGRQSPQLTRQGTSAIGPRVQLVPLHDSRGLVGFLQNARAWQRQMDSLLGLSAACILRMPGQVGQVLGRFLARRQRPYGVEVIGDPTTAFAAGSCDHPLRVALRLLASRSLRRHCAQASGVAYVTRDYLQRIYPAAKGAATASYSSIQLPPEAFSAAPRRYTDRSLALRIACVGTMSQPYKGHDLLLSALALCRDRGCQLQLILVGDGRLRADLERQAYQLGLCGGEQPSLVEFAGQLSAGRAIRDVLDSVDFYVHPSRSEGLPRAVIEAQARALPCLGTTVGGIPELLNKSELIAPDDVEGLAEAIQRLALDPTRMTRLSQENFLRAQDYSAYQLQQKRIAWYRAIRDLTAEALASRTRSEPVGCPI